jgi:hypothetical protein
MEFKGTKGRFIINKNEILNSENELIAVVYGYMVKGIYTYTEETKANVLLFSKAPEMLEMIQSLIEAKNNGNDWDSEELFIKAEVLIKESTKL